MARWINVSQMRALVSKCKAKTPKEIEAICDQFADGGTYEGSLVYVTELRKQLRLAGLILVGDEVRDTSNDVKL